MRVLVVGGSEFIGIHLVLVYDCHAVYTTTKVRAELGIRPRYTLAAGLTQTFDWYLREGLDRRDVDFTVEDAILARLGG